MDKQTWWVIAAVVGLFGLVALSEAMTDDAFFGLEAPAEPLWDHSLWDDTSVKQNYVCVNAVNNTVRLSEEGVRLAGTGPRRVAVCRLLVCPVTCPVRLNWRRLPASPRTHTRHTVGHPAAG